MRIVPILFFVSVLGIGVFLWFRNISVNTAPPIIPSQAPTITSSSQEPNIIVTSPTAGQKIVDNAVITGRARVFENTFQYRIRGWSEGTDARPQIIKEGTVTYTSPDTGIFGDFRISVPFTLDPNNYKKGDIQVFSYSPKDGEEINKVTIPILFK